MNWKNSLIVLWLISSVTWASTDARHHQTYQRLQMQLQKDPLAALEAIELFEKQVQSAQPQSKQMAAYLHLQACIALNRYACAARAADALILLNQQADRQSELLKLSAQLHYQIQNHQVVIDRVDQWLAVSRAAEVKPEAGIYAELYSLKAYSLYNQQHLRLAVNEMERAVNHQATEQRQRFMMGLYQQLDDWANVNRVLAMLVTGYANNADYWEKYAYSFLKLERDHQALNVLGSAYKSHRLPQRSIILYAQMLMRFQAPNRAVQVLESHPELLSTPSYATLLAQGYLLSKDRVKAAEWLAKSGKKNSHVTRGLIAYQQGHWQQAIAQFSHLDANKRSNHYWFLLSAISEFELKRWAEARSAFKRLSGTEYDALSKQWLSQIEYLTRG